MAFVILNKPEDIQMKLARLEPKSLEAQKQKHMKQAANSQKEKPKRIDGASLKKKIQRT